MDRITKEHRSWNMSRIRGKNTKPEIVVRKYLYANGVRYRLHAKLPGKPDITIAKKNLVIFVNGCFWHAHNNCRNFRWPKTRNKYWRDKIEKNVQRDKTNYDILINKGWKVIVVWECNLNKNSKLTLKEVITNIQENEYKQRPIHI
jgi:DNA mismatch endonuclease (patch repair protein)